MYNYTKIVVYVSRAKVDNMEYLNRILKDLVKVYAPTGALGTILLNLMIFKLGKNYRAKPASGNHCGGER